MPARVRFLIACVESMGSERRQASTTSPSVTLSHLHTTFLVGSFSFQGSFLDRVSPFQPFLGTMSGARRGLNLGSFSWIGAPLSASILATSSAMAGHAAIPGESMPATLKNPGTSARGPMIQSPVVFLARAPANVWMTLLASKSGTRFLHLERMYPRMFRPSSPATSSETWYFPSAPLAITSRAVGPRIKFPHRVVCTSTPLPYFGWGVGNRVCVHLTPSSL
mmetsp:Transcript_19465/g.54706  ORF Transcript_19465/g.54706 Transcript_19465/m.54706 type:complete len:222 (+) Transcript_19465:727-1392(+)